MAETDPKNPASPYSFELSSGGKTMGFLLDSPTSLRAIPQTPSTLALSGTEGKFGEWEAQFASVVQDSWLDGRGREFRDVRRAGYWDSQNAWTLTPDRLMPSFQHKWATGLITRDEVLPGDVTWKALFSSTRYVSTSFSSNGQTADHARLYIRRVGAAGTLTVEICSNSSGDPGSVLQTGTIAATDVTDITSVWQKFGSAFAQALTGSTTYHIKIYGASGDTEKNHWEVGVWNGGSNGKVSTDNSTWAAATYSLYFQINPAKVARTYQLFSWKLGTYALEIRDDGGSSLLYLNGKRGTATSATSTTISDSAAPFVADEFNTTWYVRITEGTGQYQVRQITDGTTTQLTVSPAWDITPSTDSQYLVFGGPKWYAIGSTGITTAKEAVVLNDILYVAQGEAVNIRRGRFTGTAHGWADDSTTKADFLFADQNAVDGPVMWRARNATVQVSRANAAACGTDLSFGTAIDVADDTYKITKIVWNNGVWVMKENHPYSITNDRAIPQLTRLAFQPNPANGKGAIMHDAFFYIPWSNGFLQRQYSSSLDDVSIPELPSGRVGRYASLFSHPAALFAAVDADTGTSGVYALENGRLGWHEMFRGHTAGARIRHIYWQDNYPSRPKLWIAIDGDLMYMEFPIQISPTRDTGLNYQHEAVIEFSTIDMDKAALRKYFDSVIAHTSNLGDNGKIPLDYKLDSDIEDDDKAWIPANQFAASPRDSLRIGVGNVVKLRPRLRIQTSDADVPPTVYATTVTGVARTPLSYQYQVRVNTRNLQVNRQGAPAPTPKEVIAFLYRAAIEARPMVVKAIWSELDEQQVLIEPASISPYYVNQYTGHQGDVITFTLRSLNSYA